MITEARNVLLLIVAAALTACGGSDTPTATPTAASASPESPVVVQYAPGLTEDVYLPDGEGQVPLVVLVPGGGWTTADPTGMAWLAASLAEDGIAAAPTHIRAQVDGVVYPVPVEDVLCAVAAAVDEVRAHGFDPDPVAVLGHSSGAHLASLAVLAYDDFSPACSSPVVEPDALIGLAGPYDISKIQQYSTALFSTGPDADPITWAAANPVLRADLRPDVPVLLMNGDNDVVVPVTFMSQFEQALTDAGHPTTAQVVPGADHLSIFSAQVAGEPITEWLLALRTSSGS